jgi:2,4-dienoyl-CoA reductase-like NADH-dependent reductase (Old Yellow Enzyme family)
LGAECAEESILPVFEEFALRGIVLRNRLGLAPMSQYCASNFRATDWHLTHYATRAIALGLVIVEATAVSPEGAVTPYDLGLWSDEQIPSLARVAEAIRQQGAVPGLQLSHAGRKASRSRPSDGDAWISLDGGGWQAIGPSPIAFADGYPIPRPLDEAGIAAVIEDFRQAARRAREAGFAFLELHAGHGRLLHSFLSPVANKREDAWGGAFANRSRLLTEVVRAVRVEWPENLPLAVRLSCIDWLENGWLLEDSILLADRLLPLGVDLIDCTSGGIKRPLSVKPTPGYQVEFARAIRHKTGIATAAVGLIADLGHAQKVIDAHDADLVLMGRTLLADPLLVMRSARCGLAPQSVVPDQYRRGLDSLARISELSDDFVPEL